MWHVRSHSSAQNAHTSLSQAAWQTMNSYGWACIRNLFTIASYCQGVLLFPFSAIQFRATTSARCRCCWCSTFVRLSAKTIFFKWMKFLCVIEIFCVFVCEASVRCIMLRSPLFLRINIDSNTHAECARSRIRDQIYWTNERTISSPFFLPHSLRITHTSKRASGQAGQQPIRS